MAAKKEVETHLYLRNRRPNRVILTHSGLRYVLERRGSREDTTSLPADAASNPTVARWLKTGILEKVSRETFMKLAARQIDLEPNQFLKRPMREGRGALAMSAAEADTTRSLTQLSDAEVHKGANPGGEWAGDLMSSEEELEHYGEELFRSPAQYPSKNRD